MTTSIRREVFYPHPPERVWRALTDPAALALWLMPNDFQPRLGHRFTFQTEPLPPDFDGIVHCEVTELDPPRRLAYTWSGGPGVDTLVRYRLEREDTGTRLHFEQSGFDLDQPGQRAAFDAMSPGWGRMFDDVLRQVIADLA
ncbi:MAG: SRPBCC domain-containing protein [Candidatus Dormibacteraeota bacterium]|nr:SRPBCC domain-containing protein [Candidatus Dormibacteraeota bacterium]